MIVAELFQAARRYAKGMTAEEGALVEIAINGLEPLAKQVESLGEEALRDVLQTITGGDTNAARSILILGASAEELIEGMEESAEEITNAPEDAEAFADAFLKAVGEVAAKVLIALL